MSWVPSPDRKKCPLVLYALADRPRGKSGAFLFFHIKLNNDGIDRKIERIDTSKNEHALF